MARLPADEGLEWDIWLLRMRALLARARGDDERVPGLGGSLSRDGEIAWLRRTHGMAAAMREPSPSRPISVRCPVLRCGFLLAGPESHAEFNRVTAVFADVVGSMDIAAALDVERLREIMPSLAASAAVVRRYGGTVEHISDGAMAIFGAPMALEDNAFRACVAARISSTRRPRWPPRYPSRWGACGCGWA